MNKKHPALTKLAFLALAFLGSSGISFAQSEAPPGRPIALVGDNYGRYDVTSISRNILEKEDWVYEDKGRFLPAAEFSKYSLVIIAQSQERPYNEEELNQIEAYLKAGGHLLLLNQAPRSMADETSELALRQFLGMDTHKIQGVAPDDAEIAKSPLLLGVVSSEGPRPSWIGGTHGATNLESDVEVLIGGNDSALVARRQVGKGWVCFLGSELFRLRAAGSSDREDSGSYVTLIRNIIATADPLTRTAWQKTQTADWLSRKTPFLIWNREWQHGTQEGPIFVPPLPTPEEVLTTLPVQLAMDEFEVRQVNLTDLDAGGVLTWKARLEGLPADALTIYVQDRPNPIPWPKDPSIAREFPYWLMPPTALKPIGKEAVEIVKGETRILWLKFDTHSLPPGKHQGSLAFFVEDKPVGTMALELQIHPVRVPRRKLITAQPLGHVYGDVNKAAPAVRFERNLESLGFEWSLINVFRPATFTVDGEGKLDPATIKNRLADIDSKTPPVLDFSSMDAYIDSALAHNLTYFRVTQSLTSSIEGLCKKAELSPEETRKARLWYFREFSRYIHDKGIRHVYISMGDELHAEELSGSFIPWSEDLRQAGLSTTSSFTTASVSDLAMTQKLAKLVGAWTLNRMFVPKFTTWVKEGKLTLPKAALVGTYGAGEGRGTEVRKNASASQMIGWEAWALGTDYCSPNPYFKSWLYYFDYRLDRGLAGERFVSFLDEKNLDAPLVNSPFIEGIRESLDDANLAAVMSWYLKKLGDAVPADLRQEAEHIVGHDEGSILQWNIGQHRVAETAFIDSTREEYTKAKQVVLSILDRLRDLARTAKIQPSLYWQGIPLITDGKLQATLISSGDVQELQASIRGLAGKELPTEEGNLPVHILVAMADDPSLPAGAKERLGQHPANYSWIRDWKEGDRTIIWIGGTDEAQVQKAMRQFSYFLRSEGAWFAL